MSQKDSHVQAPLLSEGSADLSARLLHQLGQIFQNKLAANCKGKLGLIDPKLSRQIEEKKMAHGIRL